MGPPLARSYLVLRRWRRRQPAVRFWRPGDGACRRPKPRCLDGHVARRPGAVHSRAIQSLWRVRLGAVGSLLTDRQGRLWIGAAAEWRGCTTIRSPALAATLGRLMSDKSVIGREKNAAVVSAGTSFISTSGRVHRGLTRIATPLTDPLSSPAALETSKLRRPPRPLPRSLRQTSPGRAVTRQIIR